MACSIYALWRGGLATSFFRLMLSWHDDFVDRMDNTVARCTITPRYIGAADTESFAVFTYGFALALRHLWCG
jgi:hypothetical protein